MKVLVTGAQGFVGAAVRAALTAHEHTVLTLGDDVPGDLFDEPSLRSAMRDVEGVVHLAGADDPRTPLRDAERVNLIAVENVLAAARAAGVRRLVHRSHECVTRTDQHRSYTDEKLPHAPRFADPATETLCLAEDLVLAASGGGIETVSLRPGVLWGEGDDVFLPALLRRVRDGALTWIDGGAALMATTWVESFALAVCLALTAAEAPGAAFYVTDDERVTRREFVGNLLRACGVKVPTGSVPWVVARASAALGMRPLGEVLAEGRSANFNIQRARTALGYAPAVTVAEGTRRVGAWVTAQGGWEAVARQA
jgi:nucleoside-diphosphate-sugar epimerase